MSLADTAEDPWNQVITVYVKQPTGKTLSFQVKRTDSILTVKREIQRRDGFPPSYSTLHADGEVPDESELLVNLNIGDNFTFVNVYKY